MSERDAILKTVRLRYSPSAIASWLLEFGYTPEHSERALDAAVGERGRRIVRELAAWSERRKLRGLPDALNSIMGGRRAVPRS